MSGVSPQALREAAAAAERLLADPYLREALDEITRRQTERAIVSPDAMQRETARLMVLAIGELRADLMAVIEQWRDGPAEARRAANWE